MDWMKFTINRYCGVIIVGLYQEGTMNVNSSNFNTFCSTSFGLQWDQWHNYRGA